MNSTPLRATGWSASATGEAHGDKTGERRGLEEAAVARLDLLKHLQRLFARRIAEQTVNRVPRGPVMMSALADGDERRQRVTHHRQTQGGKPVARECSQLEGQLDDIVPAAFAG